MLRSILVALDDTPGAIAARDVAIALARQTSAALTAAVVLDRPHTESDHEAVPIGGAAFKERRDAKLVAQAEAEAAAAIAAFEAACGDLPHAVERLEDAPEPALVAASIPHDLIILGRDCTLGREQADGGLAPVIEALLRDGNRPLLVVPPGGAWRREGAVIAAYDGSAPAREALHLFARLGLAGPGAVRVAAVADTRAEAEALAAEGVASLAAHGVAAEALPLLGDPADALLAALASAGARLLVMGAFGASGLVRMLVGSTTERLLRDAPAPVFVAR